MKTHTNTPTCAWEPPPAQLTLQHHDVHLWCISLDQPPISAEALAPLLAADEQQRASRFVFAHDQRRFTVGRGMLRVLLSRYLEQAPAALTFSYSPNGKPALQHPVNSLHFNLSHSHGWALYALSDGRRLGVDIEYMRPMADALNIAQRFFCPREHGILQMLPAETQRIAFFQVWTRKEACLKAYGSGLAHALHAVEVTVAPDEPATLVRIDGSADEAARWSLHSFTPVEGYMAALVVEGPDEKLHCWHW
jgi:4'-phosphopantetheinyl transferase